MYVNVPILMRFTHRWDHPLQSFYMDPGVYYRPSPTWSETVFFGMGKAFVAAHLATNHTPSAALAAVMARTSRWKAQLARNRGLTKLRDSGGLTPLPQVGEHNHAQHTSSAHPEQRTRDAAHARSLSHTRIASYLVGVGAVCHA
jgi:hypothetical protein